MWPENRFLSFLIFVHELTTGVIDPPNPMRNVAITPYTLPQPYRAWGIALWKRPLRDWSFKMMHETLDALPKQSKNGNLEQPADAWAGAIEEALEIQRQSVRHLKGRIEAGERLPQELAKVLNCTGDESRIRAETVEGILKRMLTETKALAEVVESRFKKMEDGLPKVVAVIEARAENAEARAEKAEEQLRRAEEEIRIHQSGVGVQEVVAGIRLQQLEISAQQAEERAKAAEGREQSAELRAQQAESLLQQVQADTAVKIRQAEIRAQQSAALLRTASEARRAAQEAEVRSQESEIRAQKAESELHDRLTELVAVQSQLRAMDRELAGLKAEHERLLGINHNHWVLANERQAEIEKLNSALAQLRKEHGALLRANHIHWMQANERQAQIEEMMKSLSWRCAAPVRWAGVQWRRLREESLGSRFKASLKKASRAVLPDRSRVWLRMQVSRLRNEGLSSRLKALAIKIFNRLRMRSGPNEGGDVLSRNDLNQSEDFTGVLRRITGVSNVEKWGRWSNGDQVSFEFLDPLPEHFILHLTAKGFGPNIGRKFSVSAGGSESSFELTGQPETRVLEFTNTGRPKELVIKIPVPTSPAEISENADKRKLGLGICLLDIHALGRVFQIDFSHAEKDLLTPHERRIYEKLKRALAERSGI